jgi:hypothetical protein
MHEKIKEAQEYMSEKFICRRSKCKSSYKNVDTEILMETEVLFGCKFACGWCRRMEKISWTDHVRNKEGTVDHRVTTGLTYEKLGLRPKF